MVMMVFVAESAISLGALLIGHNPRGVAAGDKSRSHTLHAAKDSARSVFNAPPKRPLRKPESNKKIMKLPAPRDETIALSRASFVAAGPWRPFQRRPHTSSPSPPPRYSGGVLYPRAEPCGWESRPKWYLPCSSTREKNGAAPGG